jgi:hypothetical protein
MIFCDKYSGPLIKRASGRLPKSNIISISWSRERDDLTVFAKKR